ncbi:hypothetical protein P7K49_015214, partial [Saguinus oedipus]
MDKDTAIPIAQGLRRELPAGMSPAVPLPLSAWPRTIQLSLQEQAACDPCPEALAPGEGPQSGGGSEEL